jgi:hypothetical protein
MMASRCQTRQIDPPVLGQVKFELMSVPPSDGGAHTLAATWAVTTLYSEGVQLK